MGETNPKPLTQRQRDILEFLRSEIKSKGYTPTIRDIGLAVGLRSTSSVHSYLNALETSGYIRRFHTKCKGRSIELCDSADS